MTPVPAPTSTSLRAFWHGLRDALLLPAWVVGLALVGVGSLARDIGYPVEVAVLSTLLVWAGPAQVIFFGSIAAGSAWTAIALSVGFSSLRFLPMTVAILPLLRRPGQGLLMQAYLAHFVAVTVWTEGLRRLPDMPPEQRIGYYLGFAHACILVSAAATWVGYFLVGALPVAFAAGLLFLTPIFFLMSLTAGARSLADGLAIALGFVLAPLFDRILPSGFDLIAAGLVGGTLAFVLRQAREKASSGDTV
ncbi:MAG: AzlC family ABC transporter permease [Bosea sp. (in: a-proteobacteria)]